MVEMENAFVLTQKLILKKKKNKVPRLLHSTVYGDLTVG